MGVPHPFFEPGTNKLTAEAKKCLRELFEAQILARFIKYPPIEIPNPIDPDPNPWPWPSPIGPLAFGDPHPEPNINGILFADMLMNAVVQSPAKKDSFNLIDAIKRENVALEALKELDQRFEFAQKSVRKMMKELS